MTSRVVLLRMRVLKSTCSEVRGVESVSGVFGIILCFGGNFEIIFVFAAADAVTYKLDWI